MRTCYRDSPIFAGSSRCTRPRIGHPRPASCLSRGETATRPRRLRERHDGPLADPSDAISSKQQVVARYHDEERVFSPHALGTKRGVAHVLVYQYAGGSRTGLPPGGEWRCLDVEELSEIRLEPVLAHRRERIQSPDLPGRGRGPG